MIVQVLGVSCFCRVTVSCAFSIGDRREAARAAGSMDGGRLGSVLIRRDGAGIEV